MTQIAYLDEFGHVGPYVSRHDPRYNDSPVFGLAGFIMPADEVRGFGTWFFQRKCQLLDFEIRRSGEHPAVWEKKGSSLYTVKNVEKYPELRRTTFRLWNKIARVGGRVFYFGIRKSAEPKAHDANALYRYVLGEAIKRLDAYCREDRAGVERSEGMSKESRRTPLTQVRARSVPKSYSGSGTSWGASISGSLRPRTSKYAPGLVS